MPVHLNPSTRRRFLQTSLTAGLGFCAFPALPAAGKTDPNLWIWLNDTHVSENTKRAPNGQNISGNLEHVVEKILALPRQPAGVAINGDCAFNSGVPGDYRQLRRLLAPLGAAGVPVHLTLGNHDHRGNFFGVLEEEAAKPRPVAARHVAVVQGPSANLFLLDSLKETNLPEGNLGTQQMKWLLQLLDSHRDRPAIVLAHHNPQWEPAPPTAKFRWSGLEESKTLFDELARRPHVKAYVHGHRHKWGLSRHEDIHIINTPATGYVGRPETSSTGWTIARLSEHGVQITRYCIDSSDPKHGGEFELAWRKG